MGIEILRELNKVWISFCYLYHEVREFIFFYLDDVVVGCKNKNINFCNVILLFLSNLLFHFKTKICALCQNSCPAREPKKAIFHGKELFFFSTKFTNLNLLHKYKGMIWYNTIFLNSKYFESISISLTDLQNNANVLECNNNQL